MNWIKTHPNRWLKIDKAWRRFGKAFELYGDALRELARLHRGFRYVIYIGQLRIGEFDPADTAYMMAISNPKEPCCLPKVGKIFRYMAGYYKVEKMYEAADSKGRIVIVEAMPA